MLRYKQLITAWCIFWGETPDDEDCPDRHMMKKRLQWIYNNSRDRKKIHKIEKAIRGVLS